MLFLYKTQFQVGPLMHIMHNQIYRIPSHSSPSGETVKPAGHTTQEYEPSEFRQMPFGHVDKELHSSISVRNNHKVNVFLFSIQNVKVLHIQKDKTTSCQSIPWPSNMATMDYNPHHSMFTFTDTWFLIMHTCSTLHIPNTPHLPDFTKCDTWLYNAFDFCVDILVVALINKYI